MVRTPSGALGPGWESARSLVGAAVRLVASAFALFAATAASAATYPKMAPVDAYLMDRTEEIALAKSAAPASISNEATVLVMTRTGYETAVHGTNGFVCWVGRGFAGASDWNERWNPKVRAAGCDNAQAARTITISAKLRTSMILAGKSDADIIDRIKSAIRTGEIAPLEPGAMCYMMSKTSYLTDMGDHAMAHVLFYTPFKDGANWGANLPGSPVMGGNFWFFLPEHAAEAATLPPISVLIVGTSNWSDGTPTAMMRM